MAMILIKFLIAIMNLIITVGLGFYVNFEIKPWFIVAGIYLLGTLLGTFFGASVNELKEELKQK